MTDMNEISRLAESMSAALKQRDEAYRRVTELNAENKVLNDTVDSYYLSLNATRKDLREALVKLTALERQARTKEKSLKDIHAAIVRGVVRSDLHKMITEARSPETRQQVPDELGNCSCSVSCGCHTYYQGQECPHCGGMCA